ncbi:class I tRNA ligase family protein [Candidatus Poribacteria bacterium]|nr:class I tRNA ligase family protein [Candidatus Poribacteria bacterium]
MLTEEKILTLWDEIDIYAQLIQRAKSTAYVLREMPTATDHLKLDVFKGKICQDIFLKSNMMQGMGVEYVPHWDYYTPTVETKALNREYKDGTFDAIRFRRQCRREFQREIDQQQNQLRTVGIFGDWKKGKTLDSRDEAKIINAFSTLQDLGYLNKDQKLGAWCPKCNTILDADEIKNQPAPAYSGYVKFPVSIGLEEFGEDVYLLARVQDLWCLAGSVAIGVQESSEYWIVELDGEILLLTEDDLLGCFPPDQQADINRLQTCPVDVLTDCFCAHPFLGKDLQVVVIPDISEQDDAPDEETTPQPLTGVRPLTPGHRPDDYQIAQILQLPITSVIDDAGRLTEDSEQFCGLEVSDAGKFIAFELEKRGYLISAESEEAHQPHCSRCDMPVLFRSIQQWIFSLDSNQLRERVLCSDEHLVSYAPKDRDWIQKTIQELSAPPVSRHRGWGTPIPIFQCQRCGRELSDTRIIKAIRTLVSRRGADSWFKLNVEDLLPPNTLCPNCDGKEFRKEFTTLDGRFAVLLNTINNFGTKGNAVNPVNVYFRYSNQFHKWFAQCVLTSIAISDVEPLNVELAGDRSNIQSVGVDQSWMEDYPKDVLRLFYIQPNLDPSSVETHLQQCHQEYSAIQELCAMILNHLEDFTPDPEEPRLELMTMPDTQELFTTASVLQSVDSAYQQRDYYQAWCLLRDFCQSDLQQFVDNWFNTSETVLEKRSCQTMLLGILYVLVQRFAPIIPFFSEQTYASIRMWVDSDLPAEDTQSEDESELSSIFLKHWISPADFPCFGDADML